MNQKTKIAIIGLGYTGLPLALAFAKKEFKVVGFDIDRQRIKQLIDGFDKNNENPKNGILNKNIIYAYDIKILKNSDFFIICVPTLLIKNQPDLSPLKKACLMVAKFIQKGSTVIIESSVYPGATEDFCLPLLEQYSRLKAKKDFYLGFSSERMNPGDKLHQLDKIIKVVSGIDEPSLNKIYNLYCHICSKGVFKANSIKVAELAKLLENIQRDVNIALMNEVSSVCHGLNISTYDVIKAASTKWNFAKFYPGLVGGYCVPINSYYLLDKANKLKTSLPLIKTARLINELMVNQIVKIINDSFMNYKKDIKKVNILVLGITFKANIRDTRHSRIIEIIKILKDKGISIFVYDPLVAKTDIEKIAFFYIKGNRKKFDMVIVNSYHDIMKNFNLEVIKKIVKPNPILIDLPNIFSKKQAARFGFQYISY